MNINKTLISIVTPLYNSDLYISSCINSVISQTYTNWELIIVDDCSTDNSVEIVKSFSDSRINIVMLDVNSGAGVARNEAIKIAKGKYIAFLDSDDIWHSKKLETQIKFMEAKNVDLSYSSYGFIDEKDNILNRYIKALPFVDYNKMLRNNYIGCLTAIYNQEKIGKIYMPEFRKRQDWGLWLKILTIIPNADSIPEVLAYYRVGNESLSKNKYKLIVSNFNFYKIGLGFSVTKSLLYMMVFLYSHFTYKAKWTNLK